MLPQIKGRTKQTIKAIEFTILFLSVYSLSLSIYSITGPSTTRFDDRPE